MNTNQKRIQCLRDAMVKKYGTKVRTDYPVGTVFNRLTVEDYERRPNGTWAVLCRCSCGNPKPKLVLYPNQMRRGLVNSCGCLNRELASERRKGKAPANKYEEGKAAFLSIFRVYKQNAWLRGYAFELTEDEFNDLTQDTCWYCGVPPQQIQHKERGNGSFIYNGIDRLDPTAGYDVKNVVPCCKQCNRAKRDMTHDEFLIWIERLVKHWVKGSRAS